MKALLLLLFIIRGVYNLQYPLTYIYKYNGRIGTGLPGIRSQAAGAGVKADVQVTMESKFSATVKLYNVLFGEFSGEVECAFRGILPIHYQPIGEATKLLEQPFRVNFKGSEGNIMEVDESEEEWATNIRKSIMLLLRVAFVNPNYSSSTNEEDGITESHTFENPVFSLMEDTLGGTCESQYTLTRVPSTMFGLKNKEMKEPMEDDIQESDVKSPESKPSNIPEIKNQLWRLLRSINYDKCQDLVIFQQSGIGNTTKAGSAQFEYVQSRSSVGEYFLRGSPGSFRVEKAVVEGDMIINPYGFQTERLHTVTNQTLQLVSVKKENPAWTVPRNTRHVKTWKYEVISPFAAPSRNAWSWVNYGRNKERDGALLPEFLVTGKRPSQQIISTLQAQMVELLNKAAKESIALTSSPSDPSSPFGSSAGAAAVHLQTVSRLAQALTKEELDHVYQTISHEADGQKELKLELLVDALAASGTGPSVRLLLEKMKKNEVRSARAASVFMTLTANLMDPKVMTEMMDYILHLDLDKSPFLSTAAVVNFATLSHRVCLSSSFKNYTIPSPVLGQERCDPAAIENRFIPHLRKKLKEGSSWQRLVAVQALANVGSRSSVELLRDVVLGRREQMIPVRTAAIYGLGRWKRPAISKNEVFNLLMSLVEDFGEHIQVRQAAITVLTSWRPSGSWWQKMARQSWRDPSRDVASYISSSIVSMSKSTDPTKNRQTINAMAALPLAKPFIPALDSSFNGYISRFSTMLSIRTLADLTWMTNTASVFPSEFYVLLKSSFGDSLLNIFEIAVTNNGLEDLYYTTMEKMSASLRQHSPGMPTITSQNKTAESMADEILKALKVKLRRQQQPESNIFLRFFETMQHYVTLNKDIIEGLLADKRTIISKLKQGLKFGVNKFLNPTSLTLFTPTDIGIPTLTMVLSPTLNIAEGNIKGRNTPSVEPVPHKSGTGSEIYFGGSVQVNYKLVSKVTTLMKSLLPWNETSVAAGVDSEMTLTLPMELDAFLSLRGGKLNMSATAFSLAPQEFPTFYAHNVPFTAVKPMLPGSDIVILKSVKAVRTVADSDTADRISIPLAPEPTGLNARFEFEGDTVSPFSTGRILQVFRDPQRLFTLMTSPTSKMWRTQLLLNPRQSNTKSLTAKALFETDSNNLFISAHLDGPQPRHFDSKIYWSQKPAEEEWIQTNINCELSTTIPPLIPEVALASVKLAVKSPKFPSNETLEHFLRRLPKMRFSAVITKGEETRRVQVAEMKGILSLSDERRNKLLQEALQNCNFDLREPLAAFRTPAIYDRVHVGITFDKTKMSLGLLNATIQFEDTLYGLTFPHLTSNYIDLHTDSNKISFDAERSLATELWTVWTRKPKEITFFDGLHISHIVDQVFSIGRHQSESQFFPVSPSNTCILSEKRVLTFDDFQYNHMTSRCWAVAAMDCTRKEWILLIKTPVSTSPGITTLSIPETRLIAPDHGLVVDMTPDGVMVNGRVIFVHGEKYTVKDKRGLVFCEVRRSPSGDHSFLMPEKIQIILTKELQLSISPRYKSRMCGLCGNYDGSSVNDLVGPEGCDYRKADVFLASWSVTAGDGCDLKRMERLKERVETYQKHCPKSAADRIPGWYCGIYIFPAIEDGSLLCVSAGVVEQVDDVKCHCMYYEVKRIPFLCWTPDRAPRELKEGIKIGYVTHQIKGDKFSVQKSFSHKFPIDCTRRKKGLALSPSVTRGTVRKRRTAHQN